MIEQDAIKQDCSEGCILKLSRRNYAVLLVLSSLFMLPACSSSASMEVAKSELAEARVALEGTKRVCQNAPDATPAVTSLISDGARSKAEWDIAAAENLKNVSPDQEWEIRKSLGAEMGLAPSEVNGWRDIYRSRAEQARRILEASKQPAAQQARAYNMTIKQSSCNAIPSAEARVVKLAKALASREQEYRYQSRFFTFGIVVLLLLLGVAVQMWRKAKVQKHTAQVAALEQITIDGQLRLAEIYFYKLAEIEKSEIVSAHASGDLALLKDLTDRAKGLPSQYEKQLHPPRPARRPL